MKNLSAGLCAIVVFCALGALNANASPLEVLVGAHKCTWGPSYWCNNLATAKGCNAVRHCIQTVWEHQVVPVDNDSICKICKDMVAEARDQLRSNETMEELKEVFEGSCALIPIRLIKKECDKLADNFVPELVEALSSQMNPDQVCSVAGLCNNADIDDMLMISYQSALDGTLKEEQSEERSAERQLSCGSCKNIGALITDNFNHADRDEMLEKILHLCGEMSSFSDACSNIALTYFNEIYEHLKQNLGAAGICHMSGVCSAQYHQHPEDIKEKETVVALVAGDDIPCELCEQLVQHLRDLLVANTTESEFKQVLEGLCKQTKGFQAECLSIVDQYYDIIYQSLVNNLNANGACFLIGVCPKGSMSSVFEGEIRPLLPVLPPAEIKITIRKKLGANEPKFTQEELQAMTLPIDHLIGAANPGLLVENGQLCTMCEYLLHFIQETLATPATEDEIKHTVENICTKLPKSVAGQCHNFIDMYGDACIALLIQGLNPREVCPKMQMCPPNHENHDDMEVFNPTPIVSVDKDESDKPTCPLCLFAVEQAQEKCKNDKSKKNIKDVLDHLCSHLPKKLQPECVDFVETYSGELVDMLIADFKPQEICVALQLCNKSPNSYLSDLGISIEDIGSSSEENSALNEIDTSNELPIEVSFDKDDMFTATPNCMLCEELIKIAEKRIGKHATKEEIKQRLATSCDKLRKNLQSKCHNFVDKYGDKIANLILKEAAPKVICTELGLCLWSEQEDLEIDEAFKYDVIALPNSQLSFTGLDDIKEPPSCVLCEFVMTKLETELKDKTTQDEIKQEIESICKRMPKTVSKSCNSFVDQYASAIFALIGSVPPKEICKELMLCFAKLDAVVNNDVIECGVCHGASSSLLPYFKHHLDHSAITSNNMISVACENLPAKYFEICSSMVKIYGQSILNLSQKPTVNEAHICAEIGKCFANEKSSLAFAKISA